METINTIELTDKDVYPDETREKIWANRNVGKSKPCIFEIRNQKVLKDLEKVMQFRIRMK